MPIYAEPRTDTLSPEAVAGHAYAAGFRGEALVTIVAIAKAESSLNAHAVGDIDLTTEGEQSTGLVQVNYRPRRDGSPDKGPRGPRYNFDPANNLRAAWEISRGGTKFSPWSTYPGAYRKHVETVRPACRAVEQRGGNPTGTASASSSSTTSYRSSGTLPKADLLDPGFRPWTGAAGFSIRGRSLTGSFDELLTGGDVDLSISETPEVVLRFDDPGLLGLWASGILAVGTAVDFRELRLEIAAVEVHGGPAREELIVTSRDAATEKLRSTFDAVTLNGQSPTELVAVLCANAKASSEFIGQATAERDTVGVDPGPEGKDEAESHADTIARLAKEAGFVFFHTGSAFYFGQPSWVLERGVPFRVRWYFDAPEALAPERIPTARRTKSDRKVEAEVTVHLPRQRGEQVRPGMRLILEDLPGFSGDYLVDHVGWPLDNLVAPVEVHAIVPRDPKPTAENVALPTGTPSGGTKSALDFVAFAQRQAGDRYVFGAEASLNNPDPDAFDCSELVQWAAGMAGVAFTDGARNQRNACQAAGTLIDLDTAYRTRGALLFRIGGATDHVAISLGDGKSTIEARGRAYGVVNAPVAGRSWTHAAKVPGMSYTR